MRVLALDTATERESVALVDGGVVRGEIRLLAPDAHSRHALPAIAFLLQSLSVAPRDVDGYALTIGPGSFTGLRVGLGTVQGLALASGRPCLGVCTLDALAARIAGAADRLVAVMDAYRGEVFSAVYDRDGRSLGEPVRGAPEALAEHVPDGAAFVGEGALRYADVIRAARPRAAFPSVELFLAGTVGRMAEPRLAAGQGVAAGALRPLYLRDADIRSTRP